MTPHRALLRLILALTDRDAITNAVSGAAGSVIAMTLLFPLDRARTLLMLERGAGADTKTAPAPKRRTIVAALREIASGPGGVAALYYGLSSMLFSLGTSNFVYFYWYAQLQRQALRAKRRFRARAGRPTADVSLGPTANLACASVAGVLNVLGTTPLWVAYMRLQRAQLEARANPQHPTEDDPHTTHKRDTTVPPPPPPPPPPKGVLATLAKVYREEGVAALWKGTVPSLVLVSNPAVQFACYDTLKRWLRAYRRATARGFSGGSSAARAAHLSSAEYFLLGAVAKAVATWVTFPLQIAQTRLRAARKHVERRRRLSSGGSDVADGGGGGETDGRFSYEYKGTVDCLQQIYREEGVRGLFKGIDAKLWQTVLTASFMFVAYERILRAIRGRLGEARK